MKQKILSILLTIEIILSCPLSVFAENNSIIKNGFGINKAELLTNEEQILTITNENDIITVKYNGENGNENDYVILAEYDLNGVLKNIYKKSAINGTVLTSEKQNGRIYKAFAINLKTMEPLCESVLYGNNAYSGTVKLPTLDNASSEATTIAMREYIDARLLLDELLEMDITDIQDNSEKKQEYYKKVEDVIVAYEDVMKSAAVLYSVADKSIELYTAELTDMENKNISLLATKEEQLHWAQALTKTYDSIKGANKLKQLGEMLGCDARTAFEHLKSSQDILMGKYNDDINTMNKWIDGLTLIQTGCKVAVCIGGAVAASGAVGGIAAAKAGAILISGADAIIDIGRAGAVITLGNESKSVETYDKVFAPFTTTTFILSITGFKNADKIDKIACLTDINGKLYDSFGCNTEQFLLKMVGEDLYADISTDKYSKEEFEKILKDPQFIGKDGYEDLLKGKENFDKDRPEITEEKLKEVLDMGDVIESGSSQYQYDALYKNFDNVAMEAYAEKMSEELGKKITFHCEERSHYTNKYFTNENGEYVGRYESYQEGVLADVYIYDDDGKLISRTMYNIVTGAIKHYCTYSDGENIGSVETDTQFNNRTEIPQPQYITENIYTDTGKKYYYGDWYEYSEDGRLLYHHTGKDGKWNKTDDFYINGSHYEIVDNEDGTLTQTVMYEHPVEGYLFDPTGHIWSKKICKYGGEYCGRYLLGELIRHEKWSLDVWREEYYETVIDENGNPQEKNVGYYTVHGYLHYPNYILNTTNEYERIEVTREGPFYYN